MRKKDLIEQNSVLFDKLQKSLVVNKDLKTELQNKDGLLNEMQQQIDELVKKVEALSNKNTFNINYENINEITPSQNDEEITENCEEVEPIKFSDEIEYGSKIIGKIVIESAKASEKVAENAELKNLILFKTESIKAEILNICDSEISFEDKKSMIDFQLQEAIDYYRSIIAQ